MSGLGMGIIPGERSFFFRNLRNGTERNVTNYFKKVGTLPAPGLGVISENDRSFTEPNGMEHWNQRFRKSRNTSSSSQGSHQSNLS